MAKQNNSSIKDVVRFCDLSNESAERPYPAHCCPASSPSGRVSPGTVIIIIICPRNQSFSLIAPAVCVKITLASKKQHRLTRRCPEIPGTVRSAAAPELPSAEGQKHRGRVPESCNYARLGETPIRHNVRNVYLMFSVLERGRIIYTGDTRHSPDSHNTNNNNHH